MNRPAEDQAGKQSSVGGWLFAILPLIVFLALAGIFYKQLASGGSSQQLPSALIGKPAPAASMEPLIGLTDKSGQVPGFDGAMLAGKLSLVNIWASWCAPCREEHPLLMQLAGDDRLQLIGLNYKDKRENALRFLGQLGNPYDAVGVDPKGRNGIEWGVYGVPETFLVGPDGTIRYKHVGPLTEKALEMTVLPLLDEMAVSIDGGAGGS